MLGWSAVELSERAGVSSATIKKYETQSGIPNANTRILTAIKLVLEQAGIEFTGDPLVNPGVTPNLKGQGISLSQIIKKSISLNLLATAIFLNIKIM